MRTILALAAGVSLALTVAAQAQTPSSPQPSTQPPAATTAPTPLARSAAPTIKQVNVVDIKELPQATQTKVNQVVAQGSDADLQKMRSSLDANPEIKSALEAKGVSSAQVILASMDADGTLTLVTKKAG